MCPECHDTGMVLVVSQDPATGEWTHWIEVRCGECPVDDDDDDDTNLDVEHGGSD